MSGGAAVKTKRQIVLFDFLFVGILLWYLITQENLDPGNVIFLYVMENIYMLYGLLAFAGVFVLYSKLFVKKDNKKKFEFTPFIKEVGSLLIGGLAVYAIVGIIILLLNVIAIELMIGYFNDNGYNFESLNILNQPEMYFEEPVADQMKKLTGFSELSLLLIFGGRYFIELVYKTMKEFKKEKDSKDVLISGFANVSIRIVLGPIVSLVSLLILVVLTAIFGVNPWIVITTLIIFRLLSNYLWIKIATWAENLLTEQDKT